MSTTIESEGYRVKVSIVDGNLTVVIDEINKGNGITVLAMYQDGKDIIRIGTDNSIRLIK